MELPANAQVVVERGNKTVYDLGDKIVKVFNDVKPASDIFNEALNLSRAVEAGIRAPRPVEVAEVEGRGWAIATEKVPGITMERALADDPSRADELMGKFVGLQVEIAAHASPLMNRQKDKYARMIDGARDQLDATTRYDLQMRLSGMPDRASVCHGDFNPSNVILGDDGELYVCDWAHATQGDPAADTAMSYLLFSLDDREVAERYLEQWCERADVARQVVQKWIPIVAAAELARKRPDDQEFLKGWIGVADWQ